MSKQYLTVHTIENAHAADIFAVAPTRSSLLTASGASAIKIYATTAPDFPLVQTLSGAHKLGVHHLATATNGRVAASAGFGGEVKVWRCEGDGDAVQDDAGAALQWRAAGTLPESTLAGGELWALALTADGGHLVASAHDGKISVWDVQSAQESGWIRVAEFETKGSFGMAVAVSENGKYTASGHENGGLYVFVNDSGRLLHSLQGLIKPVRAVAFSPESTLLAAAGESRTISLYDVRSGEQVASLTGHNSWIMSLDFSASGEWLLSGSYDGKVKIWGMETRSCVATHGEADQPVWATRWLPKRAGRGEQFVVAGANSSIAFFREASGG